MVSVLCVPYMNLNLDYIHLKDSLSTFNVFE